jgi:hypothetical protein
MPDLPTLISRVSDVVEFSRATYGGGDNGLTGVYFSPIWISPPEPADHPLLVVFFQGETSEQWKQSKQIRPGLLQSMIESKNRSVTASVTACAISAYWNCGEVRTHRYGSAPLVATSQSSTMEQSTYRKITLDIASEHPMKSAEFYSALMGLLGTSHLTSFGLGGILAAALAMWIAKVPTSVTVKQSNWSHPTIFTEYQPDKNMENYTPYEFVTTQYGYGYGVRSTSVYLSMTVLLLYCVIITGYMLYTFATGSASTAWTSGVEILALALQSKRPDHLGHIGVGIDSAKTLGEGVGIRVNADNEVELVFAHDRGFDTRSLQKVQHNKEY